MPCARDVAVLAGGAVAFVGAVALGAFSIAGLGSGEARPAPTSAPLLVSSLDPAGPDQPPTVAPAARLAPPDPAPVHDPAPAPLDRTAPAARPDREVIIHPPVDEPRKRLRPPPPEPAPRPRAPLAEDAPRAPPRSARAAPEEAPSGEQVGAPQRRVRAAPEEVPPGEQVGASQRRVRAGPLPEEALPGLERPSPVVARPRPDPRYEGVLTPAEIRRMRAQLRLTPDQEGHWPPVEDVLREIGSQQVALTRAGRRPEEAFSAEGVSGRLFWAARPLLGVLRENQEAVIRQRASSLGLEAVASYI